MQLILDTFVQINVDISGLWTRRIQLGQHDPGEYISSEPEILEVEMSEKRRVPVLLWPFYALWRLVGFVFELVGRFIAVVLGIVLVLIGIILSVTILGAIVGIPLIIAGVMLMFRGIF